MSATITSFADTTFDYALGHTTETLPHFITTGDGVTKYLSFDETTVLSTWFSIHYDTSFYSEAWVRFKPWNVATYT